MESANRQPAYIIAAGLTAVFIWGASPAATAIAGRSITPELIGGLRTLLGAVILLPLLLRYRNRIPSDWSGMCELIVGGVFGFAAYPLVLSIGVLQTSVTHASIILAAAPIFTGLFSFLVTRKWPKRQWWIGSLIALGGISLLMMARGVTQATGRSPTIWGDILVLISVFCASIGYVYGGRTSTRIGQWPATVWSITIGALVFAPFILPAAFRFNWAETEGAGIAAMAFLVLFVTVVGYALWFLALAEAGAAAIVPLQFLQPIVGVAIAILFLGETLSLTVILSTVLILLGVWFARRA